MNKESSRSHCIFTLQVNAHKLLNDGNNLEIHGKLHLVDLAGSECAKSSGGKGIAVKRERERSNINRSLLTLGRVILMLKEQCEGNALVETLEQSRKDGDKVHRSLLDTREADVERRLATRKFHAATVSVLDSIMSTLNELQKKEETYCNASIDSAEKENSSPVHPSYLDTDSNFIIIVS